MRTRHWPLVFLCSVCLGGAQEVFAAGINRPFPQHTTYHVGSIKPNNVNQAAMDTSVKRFYDAWKARYLVTVPGISPTQKYVFYNKEGYSSPSNAVSCSEGHGYGMLITVFMAGYDPEAKSNFNSLYRFSKAHPSVHHPALMAWQQVKIAGAIVDNPDGGNDSATDGDLDIAYALLLADQQWGSAGSINYGAAARTCIRAIMSKEVNQSEGIMKLGDWAANADPKYGQATRSSDFMPSHFKIFAAFDPAYASKWNHVFDKTRSIVNYQYLSGGSKSTGLMPDFFRKNASGHYVPVSGNFLEDEHDGDYDYNACRTPWRLAMDYLIGGRDTLKYQLTVLNSWIKAKTSGAPLKVKAGYYVRNGPNGSAYVDYNDLCFECPFAVSAMISSGNQAWLNALWSSMISKHPIAAEGYYGNTLKMLVMIVVSGNWW